MAGHDIDIYKERYATWRHLDGVRWQIMQLLIAMVSAGAAIAALNAVSLDWKFWLLAGLAVLAVAAVQRRVSRGIDANNKVLAEFGRKVGDDAIPDTSIRDSVTHWLTIGIALVGLGLILAGLLDLAGQFDDSAGTRAVR